MTASLLRRLARLESSAEGPRVFDLGKFFSDLLRRGESDGAPAFPPIPIRPGTDDIARWFEGILREAEHEHG
ncbi:MAG: hypothetical protein N3C63_01755 [Rhodocyclaceae bacterium]|nr:hypothetical protein [Rhodocyclaceae bacterium]